MQLLEMFSKYSEENGKALRSVFESAMIERISTEGYKMSDLLFELFLCQRAIMGLHEQISSLLSTPEKKGKK